MEKFDIFSDPKKVYSSMLKDIENAKKEIFLETYIYADDEVGRKFRDFLTKKAKEGVRVKILLDAWGAKVDKDFFLELINYGGEVRFFREIQYTWRIIGKNHERNHRKLLLIDGKISYTGSANITNAFFRGRELVLRLEGEVTLDFVKAFESNWKKFEEINAKKVFSFIHKEFVIIQDIPSGIKRYTESKYIKLINQAKRNIKIETPYFVPSFRVRRALISAVRRGVTIKLILPLSSDLRLLDVIRNRYLGRLYLFGVEIFYYTPKMLHSKLLIVDGKFFMLGSSNLDYRSFTHNYEINLFGKHRKIAAALEKYFNETLKDSIKFDYEQWKHRSSFLKIFELILAKFRRLL